MSQHKAILLLSSISNIQLPQEFTKVIIDHKANNRAESMIQWDTDLEVAMKEWMLLQQAQSIKQVIYRVELIWFNKTLTISLKTIFKDLTLVANMKWEE